MVAIAWASVADGSTPTALPLALPEFIGASVTAGQAGDRGRHRSGRLVLVNCSTGGGCPLVSVEEICHRLIVVCLSFEGPPVDGLRELLLRSRSCGQVAPLGEDLLLVNVGVVAGHRSRFVWYALVYRVGSASDRPAVTVQPLSHADRGDDGSRQDGTARDPSEAVLLRSAGEGHPNGAPDRIADDLASGAAELGIDGEHWLVCLVCFSLQGRGASLPPGGQSRDRPS